MHTQNLTLLTDLYELTMMQGYFKNNDQNDIVIFDAFYRTNPCGGGYAISAGLEQVIDYIKNLHFTSEDIAYLKSLNIFSSPHTCQDGFNTSRHHDHFSLKEKRGNSSQVCPGIN